MFGVQLSAVCISEHCSDQIYCRMRNPDKIPSGSLFSGENFSLHVFSGQPTENSCYSHFVLSKQLSGGVLPAFISAECI